METVIDENDTNYLVLTDDGGTEIRTKDSDLNKLRYGHNLAGLLDGDEMLFGGEKPAVEIVPGDEPNCYTVTLGGAGKPLHLGQQHKTDLVSALSEAYGDDGHLDTAPLVRLYEYKRASMIRDTVIEPFAAAFGGRIEVRDDGWLIHGHLLLDYEGDFYHPNTDSTTRSGNQVLPSGSAEAAYDVQISNPENIVDREITVDGSEYRLTNSEIDFVARAVWGVKKSPGRV